MEAWPAERMKRSRFCQWGSRGLWRRSFGVEKVGERGVGHGSAGVAGISFLDAVHGEGADGVDAELRYIHAVVSL